MLTALALWLTLQPLHKPLPACASKALAVEAKVLAVSDRQERILFSAIIRRAQSCPALVGSRVRLAWTSELALTSGSQVEATIRLRRVWGNVNPGGFNYRLWLLGRGYRASGYVVLGQVLPPQELLTQENRAQAPSWQSLSDVQTPLYDGLRRALAWGQRSEVTDAQWRLFRATGTIHLMVVSGLHVGIYAGLIFVLINGLLRLIPSFASLIRPRTAASWGTVVAVSSYAVTSGLGAPVVRASLGVAVGVVFVTCRRRLPPLRVLCGVGAFCLLIHPLFALQQGFWLSYAAVALLLIVLLPLQRAYTWVTGLLLCQGVLFVALSPWLSFVAGQTPWIAPLANLVVVPLMSICVIPLAIFGSQLEAMASLPDLTELLLGTFDLLMHLAISTLTHFAQWDFSMGNLAWASAVTGTCLGLVCFLPISRLSRLALVCVWLLIWAPHGSGIPRGEFKLTMLDVGQGSAAIVDLQTQRIVVDVGARYPSGFDMGEAIVVPALRRTGPLRLRMLIVSHGDIDHAGGLGAVTRSVPVAEVRDDKRFCSGRFILDEVRITLLQRDEFKSRNDSSCVVLIEGRSQRALLPGDIGKRTELELLAQLPADVAMLHVAHHGSQSSSHPALLKKLRPRWALVSAGSENIYGHPHADVVQRLQRHGATVLSTADGGALVWYSWLDRLDRHRTRLGAYDLPLVSQAHEML